MFLFRLARELGMSIRQLLSEMDSREIAEWMAYFKVEKERQEKPMKSGDDLREQFRAIAPTGKNFAANVSGKK